MGLIFEKVPPEAATHSAPSAEDGNAAGISGTVAEESETNAWIFKRAAISSSTILTGCCDEGDTEDIALSQVTEKKTKGGNFNVCD